MAVIELNARTRSSHKVLDILLLEPDPGDAARVGMLLSTKLFEGCRMIHCSTLLEARTWIERRRFDIVLVSVEHHRSESEAVLELRRRYHNIPIITLANEVNETLAIDTVRSGAQDLLLKQSLDAQRLRSAILHAIERNRLQIQLAEARNAEAEIKDRVLSHVSHELRTPLTAASQFVGILRDGIAGDLTGQQQEYIEIVDRNIAQLKRLISDLMDVARVSSGKLRLDLGLVEIDDCVAEAIEAVAADAAAKKIEVRSRQPGTMPRVLADRQRTMQVLLNLLSNAIKFTPENGRVTVQITTRADRFLQVTVADTGCGIPTDKLRLIFERLGQDQQNTEGSRKGLGLGLYISKELVHSMGGVIEVDSVVRGGSQFSFTLPIYSLEALLRRVIGQRRPKMLTLTTIFLRPKHDLATGQVPEAVLREAGRLLEECLASQEFVVVPETRFNSQATSVMALAHLDEAGAAALERRIEERLQQDWNPLRRSGCHVEICCDPFELCDAERWTFTGALRALRRRLDAVGVPSLI